MSGSTLAAATGSRSPLPTSHAYRWEHSVSGQAWHQITGATISTYTLASSDAGQHMRVRVTGTNAYGASVPEASTWGESTYATAAGFRDTTFTTNTGTAVRLAAASAIAVQSDGKSLLGGGFTTWNGTTMNRIVRLNADGTRDTAFTTNAGTDANHLAGEIAVQSDGKSLLGGWFTTWKCTTVNYVVHLRRLSAFPRQRGVADHAEGVLCARDRGRDPYRRWCHCHPWVMTRCPCAMTAPSLEGTCWA